MGGNDIFIFVEVFLFDKETPIVNRIGHMFNPTYTFMKLYLIDLLHSF